jgi:hypothetical protein
VVPLRYLYPGLDDVSWPDLVPIVTVTDGPSGVTVRRSVAGVPAQYEQNTFFAIDRTRVYRVRFWARASATANGTFYFALRQYLANGNFGPGNSGLEPYKPGAATPSSAQTWQPYSFTWSSADWQVGVTQVRPLFLLNYNGTAGYWEIQDFQMQDVTEVTAAQTAATDAAAQAALANTRYTNMSNDGVLDRSEKAQVVLDWATITGESTGLIAQAQALAVPTNSYVNATDSLATYLSGMSPAWNDTTQDTSIVRTTFNSMWTGYYNAKAALLTAVYAKTATTATDIAPTGGNMLPTNTLPNSASGFTAASSSNAYVWEGPLYDSTSYWSGGGAGGCVFTHVPTVTPPNGTYIDCYKDSGARIPVVAGRRYEFGINISSHRCSGLAVLLWYTSSGQYITETAGNFVASNGASVVTNPTDFPRSFGFVTAPPGAASAFLKGMQYHNLGGSDPYVFYSKWYIGEAGATQTVPSKWSEGGAGLSATAAAAKLAADTAVIQAALANTRYDNISSDGILDRSEKAQAVLDWQAIEGEFTGLLNKAADLGVPSAAYLAALNALADYLSLLSPAWNNTALDTSIDRTVFNAKWTGYANAKASLLTAVYAKAATLANQLVTVDLGSGTHFGARNRNDHPSEYPVGTTRQFKQADTFVFTSVSGYFTLETVKQYSDNSGGGLYQYALVDSKTYRRYTATAAGTNTSFTAWVLDLDRNSYTGDLNATVGAPSGTNVAGVLAETLVTQASTGAAAAGVVNNPPVLAAMSDISASGVYKPASPIGTQTASIAGGVGPFTIAWSVIPDIDGDTEITYTYSSITNTNDRMSFKALSQTTGGSMSSIDVTCTITDSKGRFSSRQFKVSASG